jgi:hypothetical protein
LERYLYTARRYRWVIAAILLVLGISGSIAALAEFNSAFESNATIWVSRNAQSVLQATDLTTDPSVPNFNTPAGEYAEVFGQLLQTQTFLGQVIARTSLDAQFLSSADQIAFLDDIRKRFRVQALGTNLVKVTYRGDSPNVAFEMVGAALAERDARASQQQLNSTSVTTAFYQKEYELAQQEAVRTQQDLDKFNAGHRAPLNTADDYTQRQLRLASDLAQVRVNDLKVQIDRTAIGSALLQLTGTADNQLLDPPQLQPKPSGGLRQAAFVFGVMMAGAVGLVGLLIVVGTLLTASVASEADLGRLGEASLLAAIPQLAAGRGRRPIDLRGSLAMAAFGSHDDSEISGAAS